MNIMNLTPHPIILIDVDEVHHHYHAIPPAARVTCTPGELVGDCGGFPVYASPTFGEVENLPDPDPGTTYIVSALVAARAIGRTDVVSPGTGQHDGAVRDDAGHIIGVTRLIRAPQA